MAKKTAKKLTIDKEFSTLLPPLDESEYSTLEQMTLRDGILDPIFIWRGKIVDGHNRYKIAKKHNLPFKTRELDLPNRDSVKQWILEYQLARRSISDFDKISIALKFEEFFKPKAKKNQALSKGRGKKGCSSGEQPFSSIDVLKELGKIAGVGKTNVCKVKYILQHGNDDIKKKCSKGRLPITTAYIYTKDEKRTNRKEVRTPHNETFENKRGEYENTIICGDVLKTLRKLPDDFATCFIFSPPYNNGTNYGYGIEQDSRPHKKYIEWLGKIIVECSRVLRQCGRVIINVDSMGVRRDDKNYPEGSKYSIYPDLMNVVRESKCGLIYRDEICWVKHQHGGRITAWGSYLSCSSPYLRRNHEYVLVLQKGKGSLESVNGHKSDMTKQDWNKSIYSVWQISAETKRSKDHPSPFPEELAKRLIRLYSYPNDLVCDPFVGIGTTTACAADLNRRWLGVDINPKYCKMALKRTLKK